MKTLKETINESRSFDDIKTPKYQGIDVMINNVKDVVDTDLEPKIQMLDACQTFLGKAMNCLTIATSELKDNYDDSEISKLNAINNIINKSFEDLGKIIEA